MRRLSRPTSVWPDAREAAHAGSPRTGGRSASRRERTEMQTTLGFLYKRLSEKLWIRPLLFSLLAVVATVGAAMTDALDIERLLPRIDQDTVEKLLSIIAASMLGVATFAVGSMVSAYSSVSSSATPRAFALVVADDVSKTALSTFVASFIFSVIALVAIRSGVYGRAGLFFLFVMTIAILAWVVFTFVRWVDQIARLGRVGTTIERVEKAAEAAIERRRRSPTLGGAPETNNTEPGEPLCSETIGYVQQINVDALQKCAEKNGIIVTVAALPGAFVGPGRALAYFRRTGASVGESGHVGHCKGLLHGARKELRRGSSLWPRCPVRNRRSSPVACSKRSWNCDQHHRNVRPPSGSLGFATEGTGRGVRGEVRSCMRSGLVAAGYVRRRVHRYRARRSRGYRGRHPGAEGLYFALDHRSCRAEKRGEAPFESARSRVASWR